LATTEHDDTLRSVLGRVAPGTPLRDGLERILRGNTGGLIVIGWDRVVEGLCTGGFPLDVEFSATRLRELCKMDGAVVLSTDGLRITRAATHLMPDPAIPTEESGTRHRTAQRVAQQTGFPVISVSQSMRIVSLYIGEGRYVLESTSELLSRANQAIATLERYKARLDEVSQALSALEIEDLVTVRDAAVVSQRLEMVRRISDEVTGHVVELGTDGRLLALQLDELMAGVEADRELIARDYLPTGRRARPVEAVLRDIGALSALELLDLTQVARAMGLASAPESQESAVSPRGYRLLSRVPRIPPTIRDRVVEHFGGLQKLLAASAEDLQVVEGVGETRARAVREGISRLAEVSIIDRFN
jgi:diadenylate cyclase